MYIIYCFFLLNHACRSFSSIREATLEDYGTIKRIDKEIFKESQVWDADLLLGMLKSTTTIMLLLMTSSHDDETNEGEDENDTLDDHDHNVVGFIVFDKTGKIMKIGIRPEHRCQGYGSKLLDEALHLLKYNCQERCKFPILHVSPDNEIAISLYAKRGFTVDTRVKDYYKVGEDAIRMILT